MKVAVVGSGMLGLTLAHGLSTPARVTVLEADARLGGLATWEDYGGFCWDRFYHCILPQDRHLIALLEDLGLAEDLRWTRTGTGYYARGRHVPMSSLLDMVRFPFLSWLDKARVGAAMAWARRVADPERLHRVTARDWLVRLCGERAYRGFWEPLLRAKFGPCADEVAAVFLWATLNRLSGARSPGTRRERLGYVRGGYRRILGRMEQVLRLRGVDLRTGARVTGIRSRGRGCTVRWQEGGREHEEAFDRVLFTAPTPAARAVVEGDDLVATLDRYEREHPTAQRYLGVVCGVLVLDRPLTPYYVLNIAEPDVPLTGLIEMTNLVDRREETGGRALVYLPRYLPSEDERFGREDGALLDELEDGVRRLFPDLGGCRVVGRRLHRARRVQPLPLVRDAGAGVPSSHGNGAFTVVNTARLRCATLNNDEVVRLGRRFLAEASPGDPSG